MMSPLPVRAISAPNVLEPTSAATPAVDPTAVALGELCGENGIVSVDNIRVWCAAVEAAVSAASNAWAAERVRLTSELDQARQKQTNDARELSRAQSALAEAQATLQKALTELKQANAKM